MRIQHNIQALTAQRNMAMNSRATGKSLEKLSSGFAINRAADGAASLAISEKMRAQIRGLEKAEQNAQDSISLLQTGEGALEETTSILQRMRELSLQSANGIYQQDDRQKIQDEMNELSKEIDRISKSTSFNGINLLNPSGDVDSLSFADGAIKVPVTALPSDARDVNVSIGSVTDTDGNTNWNTGDTVDITLSYVDSNGPQSQTVTVNHGDTAANFTGTELDISNFDPTGKTGEKYFATQDLNFQIGTNASESIQIRISNMSSASLGVDNLDITTVAGSNNATTTIDKAIATLSKQRSDFGATQNRLEHTINNLGISRENLTASESRIRDVDMAKEMMNFTKNNILVQASQSMLAQANAQPQSVLQLLQS